MTSLKVFSFFVMAVDKGISREGTHYYWEAINDFVELEVLAPPQ
jgi:hypothetical protein